MNFKALFQKEIIDKKRLPIIISGLWVLYWFSTSFHPNFGFLMVRFFNYGLFPVICFYVFLAIKNIKPYD